MSRPRSVLLVCVLAAAGLWRGEPCAAEISFDVTAEPVVLLPLDSDVYGPGIGVAARFAVPVTVPEWLQFAAELEYLHLPARAPSTLSAIRIGLGPGLRLPPHTRLLATIDLSLGGYAGWIHGDLSEPSQLSYRPAARFSLGCRGELTPWLGLGAEAGLTYLHRAGTTIDLGVRLGYRERPHGSLGIVPTGPDPLFPTVSVHEDVPIEFTVTNEGRFAAESIRMSVSAPPYIDEQVVWEDPGPLRAGAQITVSRPATVTRRVLGVVEGVSVPIRLTLAYTAGGTVHESIATTEIYVNDRNSIVWDDDRKASTFVTEKDAWILTLAGQAAALAASGGQPAINATFTQAAAMLHALASLGITYVVDPVSPYVTASDGRAVDFLRFPRETISHRAGDCDDLTVLYCALLEAIGVRTAFVTVPGHIFAAVALGLSPGEASRLIYNREDLIHLDDTVWLPVEVTALGDGFAAAWRAGANQVRARQGEFGFYIVRDAWGLYPPVSLEASSTAAPTLDPGQYLSLHQSRLAQVVNRELEPLAAELHARLSRSGRTPRLLNALGVLYARYGRTDDAREAFLAATEFEDYVPALVNLGNIQLLAGRPDLAQITFARAQEIQPGEPLILLSLSRANYDMGRYGDCRGYYARLAKADPDLASQNAYLAVSTRETRGSAVAVLADTVTWMEDADQ